jgi:imidazolonepropionase-like amidohydrolase
MRADIVAVRDNPLEKIETVKDVVFVMKNGKVYKNSAGEPRSAGSGRTDLIR